MISRMPVRKSTARRPASARSAPRPASKILLKDQAYTRLRSLIATGEFSPNTFLSERQLVKQLGMSKTPIRSALEQLELRGMVAISPQQGIVVKERSIREIIELFDMRCAIEPFAAGRLAVRGLLDEQKVAAAENLARQKEAADRGDFAQAAVIDIEFHLLLAAFHDNREMYNWLSICFDKLQESIRRVNRQMAGRMQNSQADHAAIVAAIHAGEPELAASRMTEHLKHGRQFLLES